MGWFNRFNEISVEHSTAGGLAFQVLVDTSHANGLTERFVIENNPGQPSVDINFRFCVLECGSIDPVVSDSVAIRFFSPATEVSPNPIQIYRKGSTKQWSWLVSQQGGMRSAVGGISSTAWQVEAYGDIYPRFRVDEMGTLTWGPGGDTPIDCEIKRAGTNRLATPGDFEVTDSGKGVILCSPNGTRFRLKVDDQGALSTEKL